MPQPLINLPISYAYDSLGFFFAATVFLSNDAWDLEV